MLCVFIYKYVDHMYIFSVHECYPEKNNILDMEFYFSPLYQNNKINVTDDDSQISKCCIWHVKNDISKWRFMCQK